VEEFRYDVIIGEGAHARSISLPIKPFTLVGATTKTGLLTSPLRDRFGFSARLEFYSIEDLSTIVTRSAQILGITIEHEGATEIAQRSRGTPRIANRLLKRVRDFAEILHHGRINKEIATQSLERLGIDADGLDQMDINILRTLVRTFQGRAVGVDTIAAALGESTSTIEDVYEPYLLQQGFLMRTPRGRVATTKAAQKLSKSSRAPL